MKMTTAAESIVVVVAAEIVEVEGVERCGSGGCGEGNAAVVEWL